jgi:hypothetical protein
MEPQRPPKIQLPFAVSLESAQDRAPEDQKLRLVRRPAQPIEEDFDRLRRFLQPVQQASQMQPGLHMAGLQLEQFTVRPNRRLRQRAGGQLVGLL